MSIIWITHWTINVVVVVVGGLTIETNNFAFGHSNVMLLDSTILDGSGRVGARTRIIPTQSGCNWGLS